MDFSEEDLEKSDKAEKSTLKGVFIQLVDPYLNKIVVFKLGDLLSKKPKPLILLNIGPDNTKTEDEKFISSFYFVRTGEKIFVSLFDHNYHVVVYKTKKSKSKA